MFAVWFINGSTAAIHGNTIQLAKDVLASSVLKNLLNGGHSSLYALCVNGFNLSQVLTKTLITGLQSRVNSVFIGIL
jgi:hypothetical protein